MEMKIKIFIGDQSSEADPGFFMGVDKLKNWGNVGRKKNLSKIRISFS